MSASSSTTTDADRRSSSASSTTTSREARPFPRDSSSATATAHEVMGGGSPTQIFQGIVQMPWQGLQNFASTIGVGTSQSPPSSSSSSTHSSSAFIESKVKSLKGQVTPLKPAKWNTENLASRFGADLASAGAAGIFLSPVVYMIDRGIIENASGRAPLMTSIKNSLIHLITRPHLYLSSKPHLLIFALYAGTYASANAIDTVTSTVRDKQASYTSSGTAKFIGTSATNVSLCVYKDSRFTKMFGVAQSSAGVPLVSKALFATRDCLTVFASFNVPPVIAPMLPVGQEIEKYASKTSIAQFLAPAGVQLFSTPLHLLGLDLYNRPRGEAVSVASRAAKVWKDWGKSCLARMARIIPAFGCGGVVNSKVRANMMKRLE